MLFVVLFLAGVINSQYILSKYWTCSLLSGVFFYISIVPLYLSLRLICQHIIVWNWIKSNWTENLDPIYIIWELKLSLRWIKQIPAFQFMTTCIELYASQCVEGACSRLDLSSGMLNFVALQFSEMLLFFYQKHKAWYSRRRDYTWNIFGHNCTSESCVKLAIMKSLICISCRVRSITL